MPIVTVSNLSSSSITIQNRQIQPSARVKLTMSDAELALYRTDLTAFQSKGTISYTVTADPNVRDEFETARKEEVASSRLVLIQKRIKFSDLSDEDTSQVITVGSLLAGDLPLRSEVVLIDGFTDDDAAEAVTVMTKIGSRNLLSQNMNILAGSATDGTSVLSTDGFLGRVAADADFTATIATTGCDVADLSEGELIVSLLALRPDTLV